DELYKLYEKEGKAFFADPWEARNHYIDVILDRSESNVKKFQAANFAPELSDDEKVSAMELLEIQRQCMLMYTSCGWFFSEISGIEPVQVMKYAARAMQLAAKFTKKDIEKKFLEILHEAKSNIPEQGSGRDIYERYVRNSIVTAKQIVSLWAVSSMYEDFEEEEDVYCYTIKKHSYKRVKKGKYCFIMGHIEVKSKITLEKNNMIFALMQYSGGDFHCAIKEYSNEAEFKNIKTELIKAYMTSPLTEVIRLIDEYFGREYFTLKDIFIEERRKILQILLKSKLERFSNAYQEMYDDGKGSIYNLQSLGLKVPDEFKISAGYALSRRFNDIVVHSTGFLEEEAVQQAVDINLEAARIEIQLDKKPSNMVFSKKILLNVNRLVNNFEIQQADVLLELFDNVEKLELEVDIAEAQNMYFDRIYHRIGILLEEGLGKRSSNRRFVEMLLDIGARLNINTDFYRSKLDRVVVQK
ncbi:MAG: DUF3536 domain-containing protein, partial [Heliobacteriaceae bacterium]|nr:DUF3536 domain-containing protein [Heliobacteriaceae bacterium]